MKFLFRSSDGFCLPQALRVKHEGNQVRFSCERKDFDKMGDGLIDKSTSFDHDADWADCIIYDIHYDGKDALPAESEKLRRRKPVLGGGKLSEQLEGDRKFGIEFARRAGVKVPAVQEFGGPVAFIKAHEYLASQPRDVDWVLKVNGKAPEGVGTFVSKDGRSGALRMLEHWGKMYEKESIRPDFIITKKIDGAEISTEAWFNGNEFLLPNHTLERTKFFPGDLGEKVGCCGNVVWAQDGPLFHKLLAPLAGELNGKFIGPLDVNVIIEEKTNEPMFLEYSPRFGYDAIFALMELFDSDFGQFLYEVATGQWAQPKLYDGFAGDVRITIPPYPAKGSGEGSLEAVGVPIFGVDPKKPSNSVHFMEVMLDAEDRLVTSGPHGCVLAISARGQSTSGAQEAAYQAVDKIHIPNNRYRNDLVEVLEEQYEKVAGTGWLDDGTKAKTIDLLASLGSRRGLRK